MRLKHIIFNIIILLCARSAHTATYTIDPRQYVDWKKCEYPYNQLVRLEASDLHHVHSCTAQFVAPDIVATAMHCIADTKTGIFASHIELQNCHGDWFSAKIVAHADTESFLNTEPRSRNDWALLRVNDPQYYSKEYFNIDNEQTKPTKISITNMSLENGNIIKYGEFPGFIGTSAGWGALPILSDEDISRIKSELKQKVAELNNGMQYNVDSSTSTLYTAGYFNKIVSKDSSKLKVHKNCNMFPDFAPKDEPPEHQSTCMVWAGNSGGAFYTESDNTLHGIASTSLYMLPNQTIRDNMALVANYTPTREIYQLTAKYSNPKQEQPKPEVPQQRLDEQPVPQTQHPEQPEQPLPPVPQQQQQQQQPSTPQQQSTPPQSDGKQEQSSTEPENETPDISEEDINNLGDNIDRDLKNLDDMSDYDFLILLGNIIDYNELRKQYEAAKAREQSIPNKLLGGLTMAATGIGGMQLASGLAEQRADEAAERDMRAYLATFRCDYGAGRNIVGGQTNIELPGGNDLLTYTTEYKQLAQNLKTAKEALGMMPGIESEVVFDKSETGLYDNVGAGAQPGAFTSLSRALMDENSADAKAWAEQKQSAHDKKNRGLTIGAVGAGAGLAGDTVINTILNKDNKSDNNTQTPSTQTNTVQ